jgi:hypothetical protein
MEAQELLKKKEMNAVSVVGVSEVWWKGQSEMKSGGYTVYCSRGEGLKEEQQ